MRIVHGSDWHGMARHCPEADLYVFTGDMLLNFPVRDKPMDRRRMDGSWGYRIDPQVENELQSKQVRQFIENGGMRRYLKSPDAPIVVVRGNHDFIDMAAMFEGCNLIHEFRDNEMIEVDGVKITGHRGIPYIFGGWNDETSRADLKDRFRAMPHADLYVTHYPLAGVLDNSFGPNPMHHDSGESYGLEGGLVDFLIYRMTPAVHLFGHIHECGGHVVQHGPVQFSNAACSVNVIDF